MQDERSSQSQTEQDLLELPPIPQESDNELWLLSYSDLMTLLFGFFVLMYVFAVQKNERSAIVAENIARQFNSEAHAAVDYVTEDLRSQIAKIPELSDVTVQENKEGITVAFHTGIAFDSARSDLRPSMVQPLSSMIEQIKAKAINYPIIVEGHTDERPLTAGPYKDNWELSAARAASVVRVFEKAGFPASHLSAIGMGSSRPLFPNRDSAGNYISENLERNRRVIIRIAVPGRFFKAEKTKPEAR